jgi:hypothetical protein
METYGTPHLFNMEWTRNSVYQLSKFLSRTSRLTETAILEN